jgi:choice-of-anchor B domain-containing protein
MKSMVKFALMFPFFVFLLTPSSSKAQGSPNVTLLANVNSYSSVGYNDCWGYTAPDGREYALLGVQNGTSIIDITDPPYDNEVAFIPSAGSLWKDIKTYRQYAYVVTESPGGMEIIDLSDLPNSASLAATYSGLSRSHNIYIDTTKAILYAEGEGSQIVRTISLSDPLNPMQLSFFGIECHDIYARNNIAYVSEGGSGSIGIYNLTNSSSPSLLRRINIPANGYVHNAWLSDDSKYLMTTEETHGKTIKLWDVSNFGSITMTDDYIGPNNFAHNTHIKGDFAYISHYEAGLRIVDISDPYDIFEVGHYDTYSGSGYGCWGAFPFFASGKVLASDVETGLYVVSFSVPTGVDGSVERPIEFAISPNYPNPFNPTTTINYDVPTSSEVMLVIYNVLGQRVRTLVNGVAEPGRYKAVWDGTNDFGLPVGSGTYLYRFDAGKFIMTEKMILLK